MDWEIFTLDDDRVRLFGQELSNELGRKIIASLEEFPKSPNDLARELNQPLTTVIFHIDKLLEAGVIETVGTMAGKRGRKTLYTLASPAFLIVPVTKERGSSYVRELMSKIIPPREILGKSLIIGILVAILILSTPWYLIGSSSSTRIVTVATPTAAEQPPVMAPGVAEKGQTPEEGYGKVLMPLVTLVIAASLLTALLTALWVLHREALLYSERNP